MSLGDVTDRADVDSDESDSDESNERRKRGRRCISRREKMKTSAADGRGRGISSCDAEQ